MKLLLFGDAASPNVVGLANGLRAAGALVVVASFEGGDVDERVRRLPRLPFIGRARYHLAAPFARVAVRSIRPDAVIGYFATGYGTLARLSGGRPLVIIAAGSDVLLTPPGSIAHRSGRRTMRAARLVVAGAAHVLDACRRMGLATATPTLVQPRGIDVDAFPAVPPLPLDPPRLISTRGLKPIYRHDLVLDAFAASSLAGAGASLTLAGEGPERHRLGEHAAGLGIGASVSFVGTVEHRELGALLADHHAYVSACPSDGVSASLLEAMAVGLVPVVVDHPANRAWIEAGDNGLLVRAGDAPALQAALERATSDGELQRRARLRNPQIVRDRADVRVNTRHVYDAIGDAIAAHRRS